MNKEVKFYLLGDSICYGQLISPHQTWVSQLAAKLDLLFDDRVFTLQSASINGNTTRQALERMSYDITSHHPEILLIQFGMNDCNYWETDFGVPRVSPKAFKANLEEMVHRSIACGTDLIFMSTNHPSMKDAFNHLPDLTHSECNGLYNEYIREVVETLKADKMPVILVDNEDVWKKHLGANQDISLKDLLLPDAIHLSKAGHDLYAKTVESVVLPAVRDFLE